MEGGVGEVEGSGGGRGGRWRRKAMGRRMKGFRARNWGWGRKRVKGGGREEVRVVGGLGEKRGKEKGKRGRKGKECIVGGRGEGRG